MATDEALDATYQVSYPDGIAHRSENLGKMNYIQATNVARQWMNDRDNVFIWDGSPQIIGVDAKGVTLLSTIDHPHYQEHLKIKRELDMAWYENRNKHLK